MISHKNEYTFCTVLIIVLDFLGGSYRNLIDREGHAYNKSILLLLDVNTENNNHF